MSRRISNKTKRARGCGRGEGADYKSWITVWEFNSRGTASLVPDWKNGRSVHCLSQLEAQAFYILRWDDGNAEVYEQFPLVEEDYSNSGTVAVADDLGLKHPRDRDHVMTTDFITVRTDGSRRAYAVKPSEEKLSDSEVRSLYIEKVYWEQRDVPFTVLYGTDINTVLADNIRLVTEFYDGTRVFDRYSAVKHRLATKEWTADLEHTVITSQMLDEIIGRNGGFL